MQLEAVPRILSTGSLLPDCRSLESYTSSERFQLVVTHHVLTTRPWGKMETKTSAERDQMHLLRAVTAKALRDWPDPNRWCKHAFHPHAHGGSHVPLSLRETHAQALLSDMVSVFKKSLTF